jgi:tRNA (adenine22-N1)-methyltransferase
MTLTACQGPLALEEDRTGGAIGAARMGPRLRAVLELCPEEGSVADIGSGHGRLALELKRRVPQRRVFATEINSGPSGELRRLLGPASGVEILEGEGLAPLAGLGCGGVVIAGLGGVTMAQILERDHDVARQLGWVCLQPAQRAERLQSWLAGAGWTLRDHRQVVEKSHLYQLYLATPP